MPWAWLLTAHVLQRQQQHHPWRRAAFLLDPFIFLKEVCTLSMKLLINRAFVHMFRFFSVLVHSKNGTEFQVMVA
jgi:hypothetical protein